MFLINSRLGLFAVTNFCSGRKALHIILAVLIPKLQTQFAEFLSVVSLKRLRILFLPTCVGFGTVQIHLCLAGFLGSVESTTL